MANSFDIPPVYDYLTKDIRGENKDYMSNIWCDYWSYFYQNLVGYLTAFGIIIPNITTTQRDQISTPSLGQQIFNTTVDAPQVYTSTGWKTFTIV